MAYSRNLNINSEDLIEEVRKRPGLYDNATKPLDRLDKLDLWKEVGAALFNDWGTLKKSVAYDRVIQMQKKWRSVRDAYMRELRWRRSGTKTGKRVYIYFKKLTFLGGMDDVTEAMMTNINEESESNHSGGSSQQRVEISVSPEPVVRAKKVKRLQRAKQRKPKHKREEISDYDDDNHQTEEIEIPAYIETDESDSDKLFLMSFLPEMRKLQPNIKMWMRAQVASIMQEAVTCQYNNTQPGASGYEGSSVNDVKNALSSSD